MSNASRKGKKAWRKNVDVQEIQEGLHELSEEKRLMGTFISEKSNENLFTIDTSGNTSLKAVMRSKKLKIDEILTPQSQIEGIVSRKHPLSITVQKILASGSAANLKKERQVSKNTMKHVEKLKVKKVLQQPPSSQNMKKRKGNNEQLHDVWASNANEQNMEQPFEKEPQNKQQQQQKNIEKESDDFIKEFQPKPVKKPKLPSAVLPEIVKAIKVDHPGASYHPKPEDHIEALEQAIGIEENRGKAHEKAVKKLLYPKELDELDDDDFLVSSDEEQEENEEEEGEENKTEVVKQEIPRKTKSQRNKEKRRKREERLIEMKKLQKGRDLAALESISNIYSDNKTTASKSNDGVNENYNSNNGDENTKKMMDKVPKRLGPLKYESERMAVALTEELPESLREIKPDVNLFKDRFKSFEERGLIESRLPCTLSDFF